MYIAQTAVSEQMGVLLLIMVCDLNIAHVPYLLTLDHPPLCMTQVIIILAIVLGYIIMILSTNGISNDGVAPLKGDTALISLGGAISYFEGIGKDKIKQNCCLTRRGRARNHVVAHSTYK